MATAVQVECLIANCGVAGVRRKRRAMLRPEHGFTVGCVCGNDLCIEPRHLQLQRWNSFGGKFADLMAKISALGIDESLDLPDEKNTNQFRCNLASTAQHTKFIVRSQPKGGGIKIIRTGTWDGEMTKKEYPVLVHKQAAPCNSLRPGAFFLGLVCFSSLHRKDIPKQQRCKAKACAFPANGNGEGLCHHHFHFFDYSVSRLGRHIDMEDIYGDDKSAPRFYVSWFWKHQSERLKFQQGGATSWWQERVKSVEAFVGYNLEKKALNMCARKKAYPSKSEAEAVLKEMAVGPKPGAVQIHSYLCPDCSQWHIGNKYTFASEMARGRVDMRASVPGLHRGVAGLHHGAKPNRRIGGGKASQSNKRRKAAAENRVGNKRTAHDPDRRWSRESLEAQADRILAASGFFEEFSAASAATCTRKIRYEDKQAAKRSLREINKNNRGGKTLEAYSCRDCSGWHLGNRWSPEAPVRSDPKGYIVKEPEFDEEQERDLVIAELSEQQNEFAEIFGE
jgi:hypothetical protein